MSSDCHALYVYQVWNLVLITRTVFLAECGHTNTHTHNVTDATDHPTYASAIPPAWIVTKVPKLYVSQHGHFTVVERKGKRRDRS